MLRCDFERRTDRERMLASECSDSEFEPEAEGDRLDVDFDRRFLPEFWVSLRLTSEPETRHEEEEDHKRMIRTRRRFGA